MDVHANNYIPDAFTIINQLPCVKIRSEPLNATDFDTYITTFAGTGFFCSLKTPEPLHNVLHSSPLSVKELCPETYGGYFQNCLIEEYRARVDEKVAYNMFGALVEPYDIKNSLYTLKVPGLREGTPQISLGDAVYLRQLLMDSKTSLPQIKCVPSDDGATITADARAGFTGFQYTAVVVMISKPSEHLMLRINGLNLLISSVFNVGFTTATHRADALQRALNGISYELSRLPHLLEVPKGNGSQKAKADHGPRTKIGLPHLKLPRPWVQSMLFPDADDGVITKTGLQSVFGQQWIDQEINFEQKRAINSIVFQKYGTLPYLISGPPGTGKTKTICEAIIQLSISQTFSGSLLVCAPSDQAADIIALRLQPHFALGLLLRMNHYSRTFAEVPRPLLSLCYVKDDLFSVPPFPRLMGYRVIVMTCRDADLLVQARVTNRDLISLQRNLAKSINPPSDRENSLTASLPLHWGALFLDEAGQATEPDTLIPLTVVAPPLASSTRPIFVLAGDQHQLGPRVVSDSTKLGISFFERIFDSEFYASHPLARGNGPAFRESHVPLFYPPFINLHRNYRSHSAILSISSKLFYNHTLLPEAQDVDSLKEWSGWRGRGWPVLFIPNGGADYCKDLTAVQGTGGGWFNPREAQIAAARAIDLVKSEFLYQQDICIMAPFGAQIQMIRQICRQAGFPGVNVGPDKAFQGLEFKCVIICTTRSSWKFIPDDIKRGMGMIGQKRKFNVAVTRAQQGLIVIGNPFVLEKDPVWKEFLYYCSRNGLMEQEMRGYEAKTDGAGRGEWVPKKEDDPGVIPGYESDILFQEEMAELSITEQRMGRVLGGRRQEDEMWIAGHAAEQEQNLSRSGELLGKRESKKGGKGKKGR